MNVHRDESPLDVQSDERPVDVHSDERPLDVHRDESPLDVHSDDSPGAVVQAFARLMEEGRIEEALALYEPEAAFAPAPGEEVRGREAIRVALERFAALEPRMTGELVKVTEAGDIALVVNRWTLSGKGPIEMGGVSADVLRRRPDGAWGILVDDPWGAEG